MTPHNLYFHVPYCESKCNYCAFYSVCTPDWNAYTKTIIDDIKSWSDKLGRIKIPTIFFGGGTPSLMPTENFAHIMDAVRENFDVDDAAEITIESNPGTLDIIRLCEFISAGVNRLSVGVQSLDDNVLKFMGRRHNASDARKLIASAQDCGIRVSGDFIYAIPNQTIAGVKKMCVDILKLELKHVSLYELSIDENTPFAKMNLQLPNDDIAAEMYETIGELFLPRYEVSNYAHAGQECLHNSNIWAGQPYIGIGPAAAGRVFLDGVWYEQSNMPDVNQWLSGAGRRFIAMDTADRAVELVITGLRTKTGVKLTPDVKQIINFDYVNSHPELFSSGKNLSLTNHGLLILDNILPNIIV